MATGLFTSSIGLEAPLLSPINHGGRESDVVQPPPPGRDLTGNGLVALAQHSPFLSSPLYSRSQQHTPHQALQSQQLQQHSQQSLQQSQPQSSASASSAAAAQQQQQQKQQQDEPLNIVIPMGGLKANSVVPRPLMNIVGRPIIFWLLDHLQLMPNDTVWIGLPKEVDEYFALSKQLAVEFPLLTVHVVPLLYPTSGPIETLFVMLRAMDEASLVRKTISLDSATLYFSDVLGAFRQVRSDFGASFYFVQDNEHDVMDANYSYIKMSGGIITDIREKVGISHFANTGAYGFPSAHALLVTCEAILDSVALTANDPGGAVAAVGGSSRGGSGASSPSGGVSPRGGARRVLNLGGGAASAASSSASSGGGAGGQPSPPAPTPLIIYPGRTYVSNAIKVLMEAGTSFVGIHVPSFACVARQDQLEDFLYHVKEGTAPLLVKQRRIRFCFDLDGTLVTPPRDPADWGSVEPIEKNIELVRQLRRVGHHIIIQTSRGMRAHSGNVGAVMRDVGAATFECLSDFDIPYDEIIFGKPEADVYVGQRHISSMIDTAQEIGWFVSPELETKGLKGAVAPRDFNTVKPVDDTHVFKTGPYDIMRGEVFWYKSIPPSLADLFPLPRTIDDGTGGVGMDAGGDAALAASSNLSAAAASSAERVVSLVMTRIDGVTFTQLMVSGAVTRGRLATLLNGIHRIHTCEEPNANFVTAAATAVATPPAASTSSSSSTTTTTTSSSSSSSSSSAVAATCCLPSAAEIEQNYAPKVRSRYEKHLELYSSFLGDVPELEDMFKIITTFLEEYIGESRFMPSAYIHGDPVFSNIILEKGGSGLANTMALPGGRGVKFIDMRGALGGRLTTSGDVLYDLSKLYQSLNGYDFMLLDLWEEKMTPTQHKQLAVLRDVFWKAVAANYAPRRAAAAMEKASKGKAGGGGGDGGGGDDGYEEVLEAAVASLTRDVTLLTAAHYFTIVPLHETRQRQLLYLQQSRHLLIECGLIASPENGV